MSLKAFHLVFIVAALLLAIAFGVWSIRQEGGGALYQGLGVFSFLVAAALGVYGVWFVRKLKDVSYL